MEELVAGPLEVRRAEPEEEPPAGLPEARRAGPLEARRAGWEEELLAGLPEAQLVEPLEEWAEELAAGPEGAALTGAFAALRAAWTERAATTSASTRTTTR